MSVLSTRPDGRSSSEVSPAESPRLERRSPPPTTEAVASYASLALGQNQVGSETPGTEVERLIAGTSADLRDLLIGQAATSGHAHSASTDERRPLDRHNSDSSGNDLPDLFDDENGSPSVDPKAPATPQVIEIPSWGALKTDQKQTRDSEFAKERPPASTLGEDGQSPAVSPLNLADAFDSAELDATADTNQNPLDGQDQPPPQRAFPSHLSGTRSQDGSRPGSSAGSPKESLEGPPKEPPQRSPSGSRPGSPKGSPKESSKGPLEESSKESPKGSPKESLEGPPKEPPQRSPSGSRPGSPKGSPKESSKGPLEESSKESPKGSPKESSAGSQPGSQPGSPKESPKASTLADRLSYIVETTVHYGQTAVFATASILVAAWASHVNDQCTGDNLRDRNAVWCYPEEAAQSVFDLL